MNFRKRIIQTAFVLLFYFMIVNQAFSFNLHDKKLLALKGDRNTQFQLGLFYQKGKNKDLLEAYYWMKMAAKKNHLSACRYVGRAHLYGKGTSINSDYAKKWFLTSAKLGDVVAMIDLGKSLELEKKWIESAAWYRIAHQYGSIDAQKFLKAISHNIQASQSDDLDIMVLKLRSSISIEENPSSAFNEILQKPIKRTELENGYTYWGQTKNGLPHGFGKKKLDQGTTYQGEFLMGLEHGYGTSFDKDGKISFQGGWKKGIPQKMGKKVVKDLTSY